MTEEAEAPFSLFMQISRDSREQKTGPPSRSEMCSTVSANASTLALLNSGNRIGCRV
jgi:hypothetical protein